MRKFFAWLKQYWHPQSISMWGGILSLVTGFAQMFGLSNPVWGHLAQLMLLLTGTPVPSGQSPPIVLIALGLGLIGLRAKMEELKVAAQQVPK